MNPAGFRYALLENENGINVAKKPVLCSYEDSKKNLWLGTDGEGLILKNSETGSVVEYRHDADDARSLSNDKVTSIVEDTYGAIWVGTRNGGLNKLDPETGAFTRIPIGDSIESIRGRAIWSLLVDQDRLWVGTEVGISLYDTSRNIAVDPVGILGPGFEMPKRVVWSMALGADNRLWIASLSGLYVGRYARSGYPGIKPQFTRITNYRSQSLHAATDGTLYLATLEDGLFKIAENDSLERPFESGMNFEDEILHAVNQDLKGDLWVTTRSGFVRIDIETGNRSSFDSRWGFEAQYYWVHNTLVASDGRVYFPSRKGLLFFDPERIGFTDELLVPLVTSIEGMDRDSRISGEPIRYIPSRDPNKSITINHNDSVLSFYYSALFYSQPSAVEYQTMLEGYDDDWSVSTTSSDVSYPLIPPGKYNFQVRSRIVGQDWGPPSEAISIHVLNPIYFRWWFVGSVILIGLGFIYLVIQIRVKKVNEQRLVLEDTVSKRTHELSERNEEILKQRNELEYHRNHLEELINNRTAELESAKEQAEESSRLKTAFLANMSHEIRTPLNSIVNFSQLLFDQNLDEKDRLKFKDIVENSSNALLRLIDDILAIARLEAGELKIDLKPCDLATLLNRLCETYQGKLRVHNMNLELSTEIPADFCGEVETDVIRLNQVLANLLDNALKFTDRGEVVFGFEVKESVVEFFVRDTGIGISKENLDKIFDRFTKIEEERRKVFQGAGLGLAISRKLVELLGGEINVKSVEGEGSVFYFTIPLKLQEGMPSKRSLKKPLFESFDWKKYTILVVEDEYSNIEVIKAFLRPTAVNVVYAEDGDQAVSCLKTDSSIDLILMDLKLPVMDGVIATQTIRAFNNKVPIIAQTAYGVSHQRIETLKCGFNDYVTKPLDRERLLTSIDHHLKHC